jgi:hypothetical protein
MCNGINPIVGGGRYDKGIYPLALFRHCVLKLIQDHPQSQQTQEILKQVQNDVIDY